MTTLAAPAAGPGSRRTPWLAALLVSLAMCGGYLLTPVFRGVWQTHYPELAERWANNGRFTLLAVFGSEVGFEELGYAAHGSLSARAFPAYDPYIRENRTARQALADAASSLTIGAVHRLCRDINATWIVCRLLCCVAWFLAIYSLAGRAGLPDEAARCTAAFVTCFSYLLTLLFWDHLSWPGGPGDLARGAWTVLSYGRTEAVTRLTRPGITYAFAFLAALAAVRAAERGGRLPMLLCGAATGLLAYVHLDAWALGLGALFSFAAVWSVKEGRPRWDLVGAAGLAALLSVPLLAAFFPPDPDLLLRTGVVAGAAPVRRFHLPSLTYLGVFLAALRWRKDAAGVMLGCLCLAAFFAANESLVLGHGLLAIGGRFMGNIFVFLFLVSCLPERWKARAGLWRRAAAVLTAAAALQSVCYAAIHFPFQGLPRDYDAALSWLRVNTKPESAVLTVNPEVVALIPAFTADTVTVAPGPTLMSTLPLADNVRRLDAALRLLALDRERYLRECLFAPDPYTRRSLVSTGLYRGGIEKTVAYNTFFYLTPRDGIQRLLEDAPRGPRPGPPDYIWFGALEREFAGKETARVLARDWEEAYRNPSLVIYRARSRT